MTAATHHALDHFPSRGEAVIADILQARAAAAPDSCVAVFTDDAWTSTQAAERTFAMANALIRRGVTPGDTVTVWGPTGREILQAWWGTNAAGAVFAPLTVAARGAFLAHALRLAAPRVLIGHGELLERLAEVTVAGLELVVWFGRAPDRELAWPTIGFDELLDGAPHERPPVVREPWDDFACICTSGTTGPSKGVRLSYASHRLYADNVLWPDIGAADRYLMALPFSHVAGTSVTYGMLARGGTTILSPGFDARTFWDDVRAHGATASFVMHGMVSFLLAQPRSPDDADNPLRIAYMGPLTRVREFCERFDVHVYTAFGMTEVPTPLRSGLDPRSETTVGRPLQDAFECRLVDAHDLPVPDGTPGELVVRHRWPWVVNSGYRAMPEATATAWRNGWFHTGDQLVVDGDGEWVFVDRIKDAIRRRGENISSYEVEAEVLTHDDVDEVAAVAVPNPDVDASSGDQEVKIVVVAAAGRTVDPEALVRYLIPRMPRHWVPRFVEVVDALPRTPTFKIRKGELREAGVTAATWDRERAGIVLKRERLGDG